MRKIGEVFFYGESNELFLAESFADENGTVTTEFRRQIVEGANNGSPVSPMPFLPQLPEQQWVEFSSKLAAIPEVNVLVATISQVAPVLHLMLGVGLGQAAKGDPRTFSIAWSTARSLGLVSNDLAVNIQGIAAQYNLPTTFVDGLVI